MKRLFLFALATMALAAGPLYVGPINLTGSGDFFWPDQDFGWGMHLNVSGSNDAGDHISISGMATQIPMNTGSGAWSAPVNSCAMGLSLGFRTCQISIDGITGLGAFFNLGGGIGIVQVYAQTPNPIGMVGTLLAEAQIVSYTQITQYPDTFPGRGLGQFEILAAPGIQHSMPEPSTAYGGLAGLALIVATWRKKLRRY